MNYQTLKEKYEKELKDINYELDIFKNSNNSEFKIAVPTLEREKEEIELLLKAINDQITNKPVKYDPDYSIFDTEEEEIQRAINTLKKFKLSDM